MMIETFNLGKRYGKHAVLEDVTFAADRGEVLALLGSNGAGKTTLLKCLLGLARCSGVARIGGRDVQRDGKEARRLAGYLPQTPVFPSYLTAGDALEFYADLRGLKGEDIDARLAQVGLTPFEHKPVSALSGGMRQRLGLAVALLGDPKVLLMDEPVANLDPEGRQLFAELISSLRAQGRTVLMSTHVLQLLEDVADRALVLADGKVAYDGDMAGLLAHGAPRSAEEIPALRLAGSNQPARLEGHALAAALAAVRGEGVA